MEMMIDQSLEGIIENVIREWFSDAEINSVSIVPDVDSDGDQILRITVVFDTREKLLDKYKMAGLVRHLRAKLAHADTEVFPLISFIAKKEAAKLRRETV